jgi:LPXTG-motif cell wall-anchored protein
MVRRPLFVVATCLLAVAFPALVRAQYTGGAVQLQNASGASTTSFHPGDAGKAVVTGAIHTETYQVDFAQSPGVIIGTGTTDASGSGTIPFTIPTTAKVGSAILTFDPTGTTSGNMTVTIQIAAAGTSLPTTGSSAPSVLSLGLAFVAFGTALVLGARRRTAGGPPITLPVYAAVPSQKVRRT